MVWFLDASCPVVLTVTAEEWHVGTLRNRLLTLEESEALLSYAYQNSQRRVPHDFVLAVLCSTSSKAKGLLRILVDDDDGDDDDVDKTTGSVDQSYEEHSGEFSATKHVVDRNAVLHYACSNPFVDPESIALLLQCWPESIRQRVVRYPLGISMAKVGFVADVGWLPLHVAASAPASAQILRLLLSVDGDENESARQVTEGQKRLPIDILWHRLFGLAQVQGQFLSDLLPKLIRNGWEGALELLNTFPDAAKMTFSGDYGNDKDTTLLAMFASLPSATAIPPEVHLNLISRLYEIHPPAIQTRVTWTRELPLHFTVRTSPPEVTEFLIKQWPQACSTPDSFSILPLHEACNYPFRSNQTCRSIRALLAAYPKAAACPVVIASETGRDCAQFPLHLWCASTRLEPRSNKSMGGEDNNDTDDDKVSALRALIAAHPAAARTKPYPLHSLLQPVTQISYNVEACLSWREQSENYILRDPCFRLVLQANPDALFDGEKEEASGIINPLFSSFSWSLPLAKDWVRAAYPKGLDICDPRTKRLPIHDLCHHYSHRRNMVCFLLAFHGLYPEGTSCPDESGSLPLHLACENHRCTWTFLWELIRCYTPALTMGDHRGRVPFIIACCNKMGNLSIQFALLRESPDVLIACIPSTAAVLTEPIT